MQSPGRHRALAWCRLGMLAMLLLPATLAAQSGAVLGTVRDAGTGAPLVAATVAVDGTARAATTRADGSFRIDSVPVGIVTLTVRAIGYRPAAVTDVVIGTGRSAVVRVTMVPQPIELAELVARPDPFAPPPGAPDDGTRLPAEAIRRAPGTQEDVLRSVALLPGVGVTSAARNDLVVRGGAPFENLFVVDGLVIEDLNHFGTQGATGGPVSLINLDLVEDVTFSAGGFGSRWGNRTGSVTAIRLRDGNPDALSGTATLSATGTGVTIEGPLGGGATFITSLRRSYLDLLFDLAGFSFLPSYWDLNARVAVPLGERDRLTLTALGAIDRVRFDNGTAENRRDNGRIPSLDQDRHAVGLTWEHTLDRGRIATTLAWGGTAFRTAQRDSLGVLLFRNDSREGQVTLRSTLQHALGDAGQLSIGAELAQWTPLRYDVHIEGVVRRDEAGDPKRLTVDAALEGWRTGAFAEVVRTAGENVTLTAGVRADRFGLLDDPIRVAPRLALEIAPTARTTLSLRGGRYWQGPSPLWLVGDPGNLDRLTPFRVDMAVAGVRHRPSDDLLVQVEGYAKRFAHYPARLWRPQAVLAPSGFGDAQTDIPFGLEPLASTGTGHSSGVELLVQRQMGRIPVYGLAAVAIARSEFEGVDGVARPGAYDTRVIATLAAGWRPGPSWEFGAKWRVASGAPTTPFHLDGPAARTPDFARYNAGERLPTFHALDIRIDRRWSWRGTQLVAYLDVQNVYGRENASRLEWDDELDAPTLGRSLGRLPSIGVSISW